MSLQSLLFRGEPKLEAAAVSDPAHIVPGAAGPHVAKLQQALMALDGVALDAGELHSARYGPATATAVLAYKKKRNIINRSYQTQADNIVGKKTIAALDQELLAQERKGRSRPLMLGVTGSDVEALQRLLNHHLSVPLPPLVVDGVFGLQTYARVIEFQTRNRFWPVRMPLYSYAGGITREPLTIDGIVGPQTLRVLLDIRVVRTAPTSRLTPTTAAVPSEPSLSAPLQRAQVKRSAVDTPPVGDPPPPKPPTTLRLVTLQAGEQVSINPWAISPFVLTGQFTLLAKNDGRPDFLLTAGGQVALNDGGANGRWTGQGFLQMGLGGFDVAKVGQLDLLNPFVQMMLQKNQGQPAGSMGFAIGNQVNYSLIRRAVAGSKDPIDVLSVFFNGQAVVNIGLNDGICTAPSGQFLIGSSFSFF